jgi:hypothetical protein
MTSVVPGNFWELGELGAFAVFARGAPVDLRPLSIYFDVPFLPFHPGLVVFSGAFERWVLIFR